jgi:class 3 adenylate cyclase/tetratricopeptide (TPR) repeat protein
LTALDAPPRSLAPYAARLALTWDERAGGADVAELDGTLLKIDLSGFTRLSERLARSERTGAEELTVVLNDLWTSLIEPLLARRGDVLQFGGDALVVWFDGPEHGARAAAAADDMQRLVRERPAERTPAGPVRLRMSAGAESGRFVVGLVGREHRELVVLGPAASAALAMEVLADPGQTVLGPTLAAQVVAGGGRALRRVEGVVLRAVPAHAPLPRAEPVAGGGAPAFLAPEIREVELAGPPLGEHRRATIAFAHLGGTDRLVKAQGAAAAHLAAATLADAVERAAADMGVCWTASDLAADGVVYLLSAGAPVATEQDEERMLRAARAVVEGCPQARVGVHTGRVFAGDVGHPDRRSYAVLGDTTNTAARLMSRAQPGQVLASRATWERSEQDHAVTWLGPLTVKGKRTAIETAAVGPRTEATRQATHDLELVGRERELEALRDHLTALRSGAARPMALLGPAGQGKSRLVAAAAAAAHAAGVDVAVATANPYESASPYGAVRGALRDLLRLSGDAQSDAARVRALVGGDLAPLLALPLSLPLETTAAVETIDAQFLQRRRDELLGEAVAAAAGRPVLLVVEDLHACDRATLDLLDTLAMRPDAGVLATGRSRPDQWPAEPARWDVLELAPLDRGAARRLLLEAAGGVAVDDADLDRLLDDAGGNPLFLRELVAWVGRSPDEGLPEDLEQVVAARIDSLPPADRALLRQAAVIGPAADLDLIAEVLDDAALRRPERWSRLADFVDLVGEVARFRHDLYRRVAYLGLAVRRRRALHGAVAASWARLRDPDAAALASHLHAAQDWSGALTWARRAGTSAQQAGALADAHRLLELALDAARRAGEPADAVADLEELLGDVTGLLGRYAVADVALRRAARVGDDRTRARRTVKRAEVVEREGRYRLALGLLTRAERTLGPAEGDPLLRAAWLRRSSTLHRYGRLRQSADVARRAAEDAERAGDRLDRARALLRLEMVTSELVLPERFEVGREALAAFDGVDSPRDLAMLLGNLGVTAYETDDWDEAVHRYRDSADDYARSGDAVGRAFAVNNAAEVLCDQGHLERARADFLEARRVFRAAGHRFGIGCTASSLGRIVARAGDLDGGRALLDEALCELADMPMFAADARARMIEVALLGRAPSAVEEADTLVADLAGADVGPVVPLTVRRYAAVARAQAGLVDDAAELLEQVLADARRERALYEVGSALTHLVHLGHVAHRAERDDAWHRLGVVEVPSYGLGA